MANQGFPAEARYHRKPGVIETDLDDEMVLMDPETRRMFSCNEVGKFIWERLDGAGLDEIRAGVVERFEVDDATAAGDVVDFVRRLGSAGLLTPSTGE